MSKKKPSRVRLQAIEGFARLLFTEAELVILLGDSPEAMGAEQVAYLRGQLQAEAEVRASILKSASTGSAPAQKLWLELVMLAKRANARSRKGSK